MKTNEPICISLFGLVGIGNIGNDAAFEAILRGLRNATPAVRINAIVIQPGATEQIFGVPSRDFNLRPSDGAIGRKTGFIAKVLRGLVREPVLCLRTFAYCRKTKHILLAGTGFLEGTAWKPFDMPYKLFRWFLMARLARTQIHLIGVGAGAPLHPLTQRFFSWSAQLATHRSFRDERSKAVVASWGVDTSNDEVVPDLVFALHHATVAPAGALGGSLVRSQTVGVGVFSNFFPDLQDQAGRRVYERYLDIMAAFVVSLMQRRFVVRYLIGDKADIAAVNALAKKVAALAPNAALPPELDPPSSMAELFDHLTLCDIVVASRLHNVIGALMQAKPVVAVGYQDKFRAQMERFGIEEYCTDFRSFSLGELKTFFDKALTNTDDLHLRIVHQSGQITRDARFHIARVVEWVGAKPAETSSEPFLATTEIRS